MKPILIKWQLGTLSQLYLTRCPTLTFTGKVTSVDPSLSDQNGSMLIKGTAVLDSISPATQETLLLGMNASVDVIGGTANNATLISVDALHEIDKINMVSMF